MNTMTPAFAYKSNKENIDLVKYTKSIRFTSNGFTISIHNDEINDLYLVNYYELPSSLSEKEKVNAICDLNKNVGINCNKNLFYFYSRINTQIPKDFYEKESDEAILSLLTPESNTSSLLSEWIDKYEFYNLSVWNTSLLSMIRELFPDFTVKTCITSLFNVLYASNESEKKVVLFVENMHFTILAADKTHFLGANGFNFFNEADFLYFTVNFIRKIFVQSDDVHILMGGNIEERSPIFLSIKKYFKQTTVFQNTHSFEIENNHYFCDLF